MKFKTIRIFAILKRYFDIVPEKEEQQYVIDSIKKDSVFRGSNVWVLIFAIFLASLGLNVNSTAVIIGAMLISPLMGPIVGMGFGIGIRDFEFFKRSFKNYLLATLISVLTATVYFLITPLSQAQSELLSRTSPTLYDVLIALFGGAAGIVAICTKGKGNVIPGVAIATALMPPLCTAGFGLATGNFNYFIGAFYLFFINTVFIAFSTFIGVRLMKFDAKVFKDKVKAKRMGRYIIVVLIVTMIPATIMTINIINKSLFENNVKNFVAKEVKQVGTKILSYEINKQDSTLRLIAIGRELSDSTIAASQEKMRFYNMENYKLQIIQGTHSDAYMGNSNVDVSRLLNEEDLYISKLKDSLSTYTKLEDVSVQIKEEIKVLYPNIASVSLGKTKQVRVADGTIENINYAIVDLKDKSQNTTEENKTFVSWLRTRTKTKDLRVIFN